MEKPKSPIFGHLDSKRPVPATLSALPSSRPHSHSAGTMLVTVLICAVFALSVSGVPLSSVAADTSSSPTTTLAMVFRANSEFAPPNEFSHSEAAAAEVGAPLLVKDSVAGESSD